MEKSKETRDYFLRRNYQNLHFRNPDLFLVLFSSSQESICCQLKSITLFKRTEHRFCMNSNNKLIPTFQKEKSPPISKALIGEIQSRRQWRYS